jgi:hypothetical protein
LIARALPAAEHELRAARATATPAALRACCRATSLLFLLCAFCALAAASRCVAPAVARRATTCCCWARSAATTRACIADLEVEVCIPRYVTSRAWNSTFSSIVTWACVGPDFQNKPCESSSTAVSQAWCWNTNAGHLVYGIDQRVHTWSPLTSAD